MSKGSKEKRKKPGPEAEVFKVELPFEEAVRAALKTPPPPKKSSS